MAELKKIPTMKELKRIYDHGKQPGVDNSINLYEKLNIEDQKSFEVEKLATDSSDENQYYSFFKVNWFLVIHCISGYYFGYQMTILNNLGEPVLKSGLDVTDSNRIDEWLGKFNMAFGVGKVIGSILGGVFAKMIGKLNVCFLAEL